MSLLPRRFRRLQFVLNYRISDLTVILEHVEKSHNLSAILRSCDAVGIIEAHAVSLRERLRIFQNTALGSQKWVRLRNYNSIVPAITQLKQRGFKIYGTNLGIGSIDYRNCDFLGPSSFLLGAEKWGLSQEAAELVDQSITIPMSGMVQSLNVSVATAILLFEVLRQRQVAETLPTNGEGLIMQHRKKLLLEYAHPQIANLYRDEGKDYPELDQHGKIILDISNNITICQ
uniref:Putative tRNA (Guanosine-2'-O-)-methyltransferase n=1 Tax=Paulinella chromatophora TaxID=39717 RepID=B1X3K6_PAUCH|nr:putative tRNA (guanosine-2'-O-) - methyltransferase [Paulinella chromatophora]ACB42525.1 putative tRNA (guanosine-2'-O-) - methyltransferase [Paulinella chromatophora]